MEVQVVVHPAGKHYRFGGGEFVVHLVWSGTGGSNEPRGSMEGREWHPNWVWQKNAVGMVMNWHCFQVISGAPLEWRECF